MKVTQVIEGSRLPVLVEAPGGASTDIGSFVREHSDAIEEHLLEYGAILFRGFAVSTADDFNRFVEAVSKRKLDYVYGSTPRTLVKKGIYTATEYAPAQEIPLHSEVAYHTDWPKKIALCCLNPATEGGSTPLADLRLVNRSAGDELVREFNDRRVRYVRHYHPNVDVPWQQVFRTKSKSGVAKFCAQYGIEDTWLDDDVLRTSQVCQGTVCHPELDETFLFNQAHLFHISSLAPNQAAALVELLGEDRLPRNAFFGDGADIPPETLSRLRSAYQDNAVDFTWEAGDVVLVDNMQVAHGRRSFKGDRQVLAALMDPMSEVAEKPRWWQRNRA